MTAGQASGAGRRLSPEEERRGAELFAQGLSTRAVAARLGVGNGTAARLRQRLERAAAATSEPETTVTEHQDAGPGPLEMTGPDVAADGHAELARLASDRDQLAETVATYEARAEASRSAVAGLEAERIQALAEGRDAQALRSRRRDAEDDARDSDDAAGIVRGRLAEVDRQIAAVTARMDLARIRTQLAEAVTARDAVYARSGDRQRAAILAVRDAAIDFVATFADEREADRGVQELAAAAATWSAQLGEPAPEVPPAVPTAVTAPAGTVVPLQFDRAMWAARQGNAKRVAALLGENFGWLPPAPPTEEEVAAWRERAAHMAYELEQLKAQQSGQPTPAATAPDYRGPADYDAYGNRLPWTQPPRRVPSRLDAWPGVFPYS